MLTQSSMLWPKMDSWAFLDGALKLGELAFLIFVKGLGAVHTFHQFLGSVGEAKIGEIWPKMDSLGPFWTR